MNGHCLLYTSDAADEGLGVDLGGRRIIKIMQRVINTVVELYELLSSFIVCIIKTIESSKLKNMRFYTYKRSICQFSTKNIFSGVLSLLGRGSKSEEHLGSKILKKLL